MAETQRQPVPRNDAGELDTARAFLGFARGCVLKKADGLDDEHMVVPSGTSADQVLQDYRDAIADSDAIIEAAGDPEARTAVAVYNQPMTLRWVIAHMIGEVTRHAGHADILREQIDGTTGR